MIKVKIDNEAIKDIEIKTEVTETTVKVTVEAKDEESGVEDFYYKVNDSEYIKSENGNINIEGLKPGTEYEVTIKVVDKLGNEKEVTFKVTTEEAKEDSSNTTNEAPPQGEASDTTTNNNNTNNDTNDETEDKKEDTTLSEMPEISLSGVPTYFEAGESYKLPTSYKLGKSGGTVKCTVNGTEYKNTSELGLGVHKIKCKAVSNTGLSVEVQKDVEVIPETSEEMIWDGWITMNLYFPANSTDWQWRLGNEEETRTGEEDTGWQDYTGPITVRLTDVENVYIRYKLNGEEVIIPPKGKLLVDIQPGSYQI